MGLGSFLFGSPQGQNTTFQLDPAGQAFLNQYRQMAGGAANQLQQGGSITPGMTQMSQWGLNQMRNYGQLNPQLQAAYGGYQGLAGNLGFGSQTGYGNIGDYMNPYIGQVVDSTNAAWDRSGQQAMNAAADQATRAGAFGGSRGAVLQGTALGQNELARNQQIAGLYQGGFQDAAQALSADRYRMANLGLAGLGGMGDIGQLGKQYQMQQIQGLLQGGDYQRQIQQQQMLDPYMRAQLGLGLMTPAFGQGGYTQSTQQTGGGGLIPGLIGGGMAGAGIPGIPGSGFYGMALGGLAGAFGGRG